MNYFRPQKLSDALIWLTDNNAGIAAGCTDLFAVTGSQYLQKNAYENLLDITAIDDLGAITQTGDSIRIGAGASWRDIIRAELPPAFDGLKAAAREVGSVQIQNSGTIGGNLCNASPAADGVPPLLTLDASVELASATGTRTLPLPDFLLGPRQTALKQDEILTAISVSDASTDGISNFIKLGARKYLVISIAMAAVRLVVINNSIADIAVSVGSCSAVAARLDGVEAALRGRPTGISLQDIITEESLANDLSPIDDIRADAAYRMTAAREIVIRAVGQLLAAAGKTS